MSSLPTRVYTYYNMYRHQWHTYIIYTRVYRVVIIIIRWQTRRDAFIGSRWQLNGSQTENTIAAATFAREYPHKLRWLRVSMAVVSAASISESRAEWRRNGSHDDTRLELYCVGNDMLFIWWRNVTPNCRSPSRIKVFVLSPPPSRLRCGTIGRQVPI